MLEYDLLLLCNVGACSLMLVILLCNYELHKPQQRAVWHVRSLSAEVQEGTGYLAMGSGRRCMFSVWWHMACSLQQLVKVEELTAVSTIYITHIQHPGPAFVPHTCPPPFPPDPLPLGSWRGLP